MMKDLLLYIAWNPSLDAFNIGPLSFRWYSLCWLIGLALAYIVVRKLFKDQKIPDEKFDPLFIYCFLGILIGARLGHCIFYEPTQYLTSVKGFIEMLLPIHFTSPDGWDWKMTGYEGLASHGGTLGLIIALWLYVRSTKVPLWQVLDNIAIATGTTACFIRLGNLMNSEIIGNVTSVPWAFEFLQRDGLPRHPAQLYEALAYALLFVVMIIIYRKDRKTFAQGHSPLTLHQTRHRLVFRILPHLDLHIPLLRGVPQEGAGGLRRGHAARHGPAAQHPIHHHRHLLHGKGKEKSSLNDIPAARAKAAAGQGSRYRSPRRHAASTPIAWCRRAMPIDNRRRGRRSPSPQGSS